MLNVDLQSLLTDGISRYELVAATAKRARLLVDETAARKNANRSKDKEKDLSNVIVGKPVSIAIKELQEGMWRIKTEK